MDLQAEVTEYTFRHPYRSERVRHANKESDVWRYVLRVTEQPDPMLSVLAGDVIHNLRSALDHLAVAIAPRKRRREAGFPIETRDIWAKDETGRFLVDDDKARTSYRSKLEGMPERAVAIIEELQPYAIGEDARRHILGIVSRLDNADKHRDLILVTVGLTGVRTTIRAGDETHFQQPVEPDTMRGLGFAKDGAEIANFGFPRRDPPDESEVNVEVTGTPLVALDVGLEDGFVDALATLQSAIIGIRSEAFPLLEPFVRP